MPGTKIAVRLLLIFTAKKKKNLARKTLQDFQSIGTLVKINKNQQKQKPDTKHHCSMSYDRSISILYILCLFIYVIASFNLLATGSYLYLFPPSLLWGFSRAATRSSLVVKPAKRVNESSELLSNRHKVALHGVCEYLQICLRFWLPNIGNVHSQSVLQRPAH